MTSYMALKQQLNKCTEGVTDDVDHLIDSSISFVNQNTDKYDVDIDFYEDNKDLYKFRCPFSKEDMKNDQSIKQKADKMVQKFYKRYSKLFEDKNEFMKYVIFGDTRLCGKEFTSIAPVFTTLKKYKVTESKVVKEHYELNLETADIDVWLCESAIEMAVCSFVRTGNYYPTVEDVRHVLVKYTQWILTSSEILNLFSYGISVIRKKLALYAVAVSTDTAQTEVMVNRLKQLSIKQNIDVDSFFNNPNTDTVLERAFTKFVYKVSELCNIEEADISVQMRQRNRVITAILNVLDKLYNVFLQGGYQLEDLFTQIKLIFENIYGEMTSKIVNTNKFLKTMFDEIKQRMNELFLVSHDRSKFIALMDTWINAAMKEDKTFTDKIISRIGYVLYQIATSKVGVKVLEFIIKIRDSLKISKSEIFEAKTNINIAINNIKEKVIAMTSQFECKIFEHYNRLTTVLGDAGKKSKKVYKRVRDMSVKYKRIIFDKMQDLKDKVSAEVYAQFLRTINDQLYAADDIDDDYQYLDEMERILNYIDANVDMQVYNNAKLTQIVGSHSQVEEDF